MTKMEALLLKLRKIGFEEVKRYEKKECVIGTALTGSLGRGDIWEGSDVDIYIVQENDETEVQGESYRKGGFLVNMHYVSKTLLEKLNDLEFFARSTIPDEWYSCKIVYDPKKVLTRAKTLIEKKRFSDEIIARKINLLRIKVREDLASASLALGQDDLPAAMFYCWTMPIPHILFIHFRELIRSVSRFPELFTQLCTEKKMDRQLREYFGAKVDVKELETTSNYFVEAWEEVGVIFKEFSSTQMMKELSPSVAKWVRGICELGSQLGERMAPLKNYEAHIKHGYLQGALDSMRANATQDLTHIMNRLYEGVFKRLPACEEPFSPFRILRINKFVSLKLYERILQANGIHNIDNEEVKTLIKERANSFEKVNSIIENANI